MDSLFPIDPSLLPDVLPNASSDLQPLATEERYILTEAGQQQWAFPSSWVAEILVIERAQMLTLPCYGAAVLGVVHYHGQVIPLVIPPRFATSSRVLKETLTIIKLNQTVKPLANVGIVVDRILSGCKRSDLPPTLFVPQTGTPDPPSVQLFSPQLLPDTVWQPRA